MSPSSVGDIRVAYHAICATIDDAQLDGQKAHTRNEFWLHRIDVLMRAAGLQGNGPLAHDPKGELPKLLADLPASDWSELDQLSMDLRELQRFATGHRLSGAGLKVILSVPATCRGLSRFLAGCRRPLFLCIRRNSTKRYRSCFSRGYSSDGVVKLFASFGGRR
jgi:hypothetical protein